jgi:hypothetical protein
MFTRSIFALTIVLSASAAAFAGTRYQSATPHHDVYDNRGSYAGTDPDRNVRFELRRDDGRGQN